MNNRHNYPSIKFLKLIAFIIVSVLLFSVIIIHSEDKFDYTSAELEAVEAFPLKDNDRIIQKLTGIENDYLNSIGIRYGTYNRINDGILTVSLLKNDDTVFSWSVPAGEIIDNDYTDFKLPDLIKLDSQADYFLQISEKFEGDNGIAVWKNKERQDDKIGTVCYMLTYRDCKKQLITNVIFGVIWILVVLMIIINIPDWIIMSCILAVLMACYLSICYPGMAPDESSHFKRAFEISEGRFITRYIGDNGEAGGYLPKSLLLFSDSEAVIDSENREEMSFNNTALYSPVNYFPQAIGIKLARYCTQKVRGIFYGGKIGSAICCLILCVLALRFIPFGKTVLFICMTFPIALQEMVILSADGITIALSMFFIAYLFYLAYSSKNLSWIEIMLLLICGIMLALCKIVYVVLILLVLLLPESKFSSKKLEYGVKIGLICSAVFANLVWFRISSGYLVEFQPGVDCIGQIKYVLTHLFSYYKIIIRTLLVQLSSWILTMTGGMMGAMNIRITSIMWIMEVVLLIYEVLTCKDKISHINGKDIFLLFFTFIMGSGLIMTSLYVQWTPYRNEIINGVQGRYFIPIICTLAFGIVMLREKIENITVDPYNSILKKSYSYLIVLLLNGITLLDMIAFVLRNN